MKVKNTSSRLHRVGNVSIAPGEVKIIPDEYKKSINTDELVEIDGEMISTNKRRVKSDIGD